MEKKTEKSPIFDFLNLGRTIVFIMQQIKVHIFNDNDRAEILYLTFLFFPCFLKS